MKFIPQGDYYRLYINITNYCNAECPFCCMYCSRNNTSFMGFEQFRMIINSFNDIFEVQLEGGEPLMHPLFRKFVELCIENQNCRKIIILTNGMLINEQLQFLIQAASHNRKVIEIRISYNYHLNSIDSMLADRISEIYKETINLPYVEFCVNVRKRHNTDEDLVKTIIQKTEPEACNVYELLAYGRMTGSDYALPETFNELQNWAMYSSDGINFYNDFIARSIHEQSLKQSYLTHLFPDFTVVLTQYIQSNLILYIQ